MGMSYCEDLITPWGSPCSTELLLSLFLQENLGNAKVHPKMVKISSIYSALVYFARMFAGPTVILSKPIVDQ
jgi:hypothetical protein